MEAVATSGLKALIDTGGPGWIVAALALIAVVLLYRELKLCQAQHLTTTKETLTALASQTQASQATTIALEAVKRSQEDIARLIVENNRTLSSMETAKQLADKDLEGHRRELMQALNDLKAGHNGRSRRAP